jgi:hypothetical protein
MMFVLMLFVVACLFVCLLAGWLVNWLRDVFFFSFLYEEPVHTRMEREGWKC